MTRSVTLYGVLLVVLLGLSWEQWTSPPEPDRGDKIELIGGTVDDVEKIVWKGEKDEATIERKTDAAGAYLWVTYTKWEEAKKPEPAPAPADPAAPTDPAADPAAAPTPPAAEPETVAKTQIFKAGDAGDKLVESLSPLLALRELTDVPADKLATLGLDAPKEHLEITRKGRTRTLDVGGEAYGSKDRYVKDTESGKIYLLDDETLRPLKYARTRLPDRAIFALPREKIATAVVSSGVGSLEIAQKNPDDKEKATWVKASEPDAAAEQVKTWMDKALQLKSTSYVGADEMPADLTSSFRLTLRGADGKTETLEVLSAGGDWYARSEHTRGLVKLLKGPTSALAEDVADLTAATAP